MTTVIGLFDSVGEAEKAAGDLMSTGFSPEDIGLIASDATGEWSRYKVSTLEGAGPSSKAVGTKMGAGTAVGGLGGLVIGELAIGLDNVAGLIARRLQHGAYDVGTPRPAREARESATCLGVPVGCPQPHEGRTIYTPPLSGTERPGPRSRPHRG